MKNPPTFFSMTIARRHSGAETELTAIREALGNIENQKMVFVATNENLSKFEPTIMNIQQFVMCYEVVASESPKKPSAMRQRSMQLFRLMEDGNYSVYSEEGGDGDKAAC